MPKKSKKQAKAAARPNVPLESVTETFPDISHPAQTCRSESWTVDTTTDDLFLDLVNHLFLPPKLPQTSDGRDNHHGYIIDRVFEAVIGFRNAMEADGFLSQPLVTIEKMMAAMQSAHSARCLTRQGLENVLSIMQPGGEYRLPAPLQSLVLIFVRCYTSTRLRSERCYHLP
jgi:hypothetical protein